MINNDKKQIRLDWSVKKQAMTFKKMKIVLLSILCFSTFMLMAQSQNKRRVMLFADSEHNTTLIQQKQILASDEAGCLDRDMVIETYLFNKTDKKVRNKYNILSAPFTFLLIGKDGHVALRADKSIPKARLFALIDGMPMRRDEMSRKGH